MKSARNVIGGLGNLMFKQAFLWTMFREGIIPDVYLQDEIYFGKYKDEIKQMYGEGIDTLPFPYTAIHVRRGDYVDNPFYVDLFKDGYYERAMKLFPGKRFIVFSDDIPWCKEQEIFKDCLFSEDKSETEDMNLMASCIGHIIANSSFSWWGAWLSPHTKKVVAPRNWYSDGQERTKVPDTWLKI